MSLLCQVVSPEGEIFSGKVRSVRLPAFDGQREVYAQHAPCLLMMVPGVIAIFDAQGTQTSYVVEGGYAEITNHSILVLAEKIVPQAEWNSEKNIALISAAEDAYQEASFDDKDEVAVVRAAAQSLLHTLPMGTSH